MGAGHAHALYVHGHSRLHAFAPEAKLVGAFGLVAAAALTPREAVWAFAAYAAVLVALIAGAGLGPRFVFARLAVIVPFVAFALALPFVAGGPRVEVLGLTVSQSGLWGLWNVLAKATIGASTSILLAGTTEVPRLLDGMTRLRVPRTLTMIAAFMVRYLELIAGELRRMRTAMAARGYEPRWLWQTKPIAAAAGALFVRSYERGERIHAAMLARGYTGTMPMLQDRCASGREWALTAAVLLPVWLVAGLALAGVR